MWILELCGVDDFAAGARDEPAENFSFNGFRDKVDVAVAEEQHRPASVLASNLVVACPGLGVVDSAGLDEYVATINPLTIWPAHVFGDDQSVGQAVADVPECNFGVVQQNSVVRLTGKHAFAKQSAVVGLSSYQLAFGSRRAFVHGKASGGSFGVFGCIERYIEVNGMG